MLVHMGPSAAALPLNESSVDTAAEARAFEDWLAGDLSMQSEAYALVVSPQALDRRRFAAVHGLTILCCPRGGRNDLRAGLDLESARTTFDVVYLHQMIGVAMDGRWADRAYRMLRPGGSIVVAVDPSEFSFAPLPAGGDERLLVRILIDSGFCRVRLLRHRTRLIIATAQRDAPELGR